MGLFRGTNTVTKADKIESLNLATAEYGACVREVLGTTKVSPQIIDYVDFTAHEHKTTTTAGKGGKSKSTSITYTYTVAAVLGLCEGTISKVGTVWKDNATSSLSELDLTLFDGSQTAAWAYMLSQHPDHALVYENLAYAAGTLDLGESASAPSIALEIYGKLLSTGDGTDVNPADYIRYILDKVGVTTEIEGLDDYRAYCASKDLLISTPSDATETETARDIINDICELTDAYMFWSNDRFKIVCRDDVAVGSYAPNKTVMYDLTADDFIEQSNGAMVTYARKDSSELYNRFSVEFINRSNSYETETVSYNMTDDIALYGVRQNSTVSAHYIYTKERAIKIAEALARKNKYERTKYTFKLDWAFCRLEPGDLVTLTDDNIGLNKQIAMIDSVTEDANGILTITAISRADGDYTAAIYDVHEVDRPYIDFNTAPGDTTAFIFQPPSELTDSGNEIWFALKGGDNWGGCSIWCSDNGDNYVNVGQVAVKTRFGALESAIDAFNTSLTAAINGDFLSGTAADAENGNTRLWIDGECMSYVTATLIADGVWTFSGLVRGQNNTTAISHSVGTTIVRTDGTLFTESVGKSDVGKKLYFKFLSYNVFGAAEQSLADVDEYEYTVLSYYIPPVQNLSAYNRYRQLVDGVARYDIVVEWDKPDLSTYLQGDVWYKTNHAQAENIVVTSGMSADELAFGNDWTFGGSGKSQVVIPQAIVGDTYRLAVCTKDEYGESTSPDSAPTIDILVAMKTELPNTPDGLSLVFGTTAIASWGEVTNADIAYYEIRSDENPGAETAGLLARVTGLSTSVTLNGRSGTLYCYAVSAQGKYSLPAALEYNKAEPEQPDPPEVTAKLGGMAIVTDDIPSGCSGVNIYINDDMLYSVNHAVTYSCGAGIYDVSVAFVDYFGEGPVSGETRCTVKAQVDSDMLAAEAVQVENVDATIKSALENAIQSVEDIKLINSDITTINSSISELIQTDTTLQNTIVANKTAQDEVNSAQETTNASLASQITQTAETINSTVQSIKTELEEGISANATEISNVKQTAADISSTVTANKTAQDEVNSAQETTNASLTSQITQTASSVTSIVADLSGNAEDSSYTAIAQLNDAIGLRVEKDGVITAINASTEGIYISGKLLHVTGDTVFDNNVITNGMLAAGSITADKMDVDSLSAITATIGTLRTATSGARLEIHDNLLLVYDENDTLRVRLGVW